MKTHRITIVVHSLHGGGAEKVAAVLASSWAERGNPVTVLTFEEEGKVESYPLNEQVFVNRLGLAHASSSKIEALAMLWKRFSRIRKAIKDSRPDVVVGFVSEVNVLVTLACQGTGVPVVISEHCHPDHFHIGREWAFLRRVVYPLADSMVAVSKGVLDWFSWLSIPKRVIYNPTASFIVQPKSADQSDESKLIAAAGRLAYQKGFDLLINSFVQIAEKYGDWRMVIYGEGPDREQLESMVARYGLKDRILLPGVVQDLSERLAEADIFVMSSRFEGFGNVLVEAMNVGLPVIAFDCQSGPSEIITHGRDGYLVPVGDEKALADAMADLVENEGARKEFGRNGYDASQRFSVERIADAWDEAVNEVMETS